MGKSPISFFPPIDLPKPGERLTCARVPDSMGGFVVSDLLNQSVDKSFVYVVQDEQRLQQLRLLLGFLDAETTHHILTFPAWDCLPYDRVSPRADIMAERMHTLGELKAAQRPVCLLTTPRALLQKVPPQTVFSKRPYTIRVGDDLNLEELKTFLSEHGYSRVATVREPGGYAIRGGIIDLFPAGERDPLRLDLFGSQVESIKTFDPISQRSQQKRHSFALAEVGELVLTQTCIDSFRSGYRQRFGSQAMQDALYQSISAGQTHMGMEHRLPLFYSNLELLFDFLPQQQTAFCLEHEIRHSFVNYQEHVQDYYQARCDGGTNIMQGHEQLYRPLPPEELYLTKVQLEEKMNLYPLIEFSPFLTQESQKKSVDFQAQGLILNREGNDDSHDFHSLETALQDWQHEKKAIIYATYSQDTQKNTQTILSNHGIGPFKQIKSWSEWQTTDRKVIASAQLTLEQGFVSPGFVVITEQDLFGQRQVRPKHRRAKSDAFLRDLSDVSLNDLVVHEEHGVGKYLGLSPIVANNVPHDCLRVEYAGGDKLFVPVENIDVLSLYGSEGSQVHLDRLGASSWQKRKASVKKRLEVIAGQLLEIAAERQTRKGDRFQLHEGLYQEFSARFAYPETNDQLRAIQDALTDLESGQPMDRLICGDVGFGKTEVALRAAFVVANSGHQVAIIVPTTLLARQHFRNFCDRFDDFHLKTAQLSRMIKPSDKTKIIADLERGQVNIIVGTHALLSPKIKFKNLGLVIIDEEQHFGVKQKEKLKALKSQVHVLTLTATPIPRTLQMALTGVKDMSLIATPPVDRLAVRTYVMPFDGVVIKEAIVREIDRGGQVFYVCPRLEDLPKVYSALRELLPQTKIATAHGQMPAAQLEEVMLGFYQGTCQILISTNIVESGLDIPTANTIIIHRSDRFGLAQLYQLRGRVGRAKQRGYAYFLLPAYQISEKAQKRLEVMQTLDSLGAGFQLASHDMDIRGAGNLLGAEQSGHIREVGVELYQQMLEEAVETARRQSKPEASVTSDLPSWTPQINVPVPVLLPDDYVEDLAERLALYRRLSLLTSPDEIEELQEELKDRFGTIPEEVANLLQIIELKQLCQEAGVFKVDCGDRGVVIQFKENRFANPLALIEYLQQYPERFKLRPDQSLVFMMHWEDSEQLFTGIKAILKDLLKLAGK